MECKSQTINGRACGANAQTGSNYCYRHDPINKEKSLLASKRGGENRRLQEVFGEPVKIESANDVKTFLGIVINSIWTGRAPVQAGTALGFLTRCWLDAYETSELEKRLTEVENKLNIQIK